MRDAFLLHRGARAALIAFCCGCAGGAPESLERRQQQAPISYPAGSFAGAGGSQRPAPPDGAAGAASSRDPALSNGAAGSTSMPPRNGTDAGDGGEVPAEQGGSAGDGTAGAGTSPPNGSAGGGAAGAGAGPDTGMIEPPAPADCFDARLLWSDDFESNDYRNWTSQSYGASWGDACQDNVISDEAAVSGTRSQRSEITCAYTADTVHRGYGGVQFDGDDVVPAFTNQGVGIDAPHGLVNTLWIRLDSDTVFENGKWVSFFTVNGDCTWTDSQDRVLGFGIEDASGRLAAAHYQAGAGGTRTFEPDAPTLPRHRWVRVTTYVNYHSGVMHIWQDGRSVQHVTFSRPLQTICHWHWGLYASANNDDIVLFEDDNSIWKLNEPWSDFSIEPHFGENVTACD